MFLILNNGGTLNLNEIKNECSPGKWFPAMVYRPSSESESPPTVIVFTSENVAYQFTKRNVLRMHQKQGHYRGTIQISDKTIAWIEKQGWAIEMLDWPKKIVGNPAYTVGLEIVELQEEEAPDVLISSSYKEGVRHRI